MSRAKPETVRKVFDAELITRPWGPPNTYIIALRDEKRQFKDADIARVTVELLKRGSC
jgi:hypothetical protein